MVHTRSMSGGGGGRVRQRPGLGGAAIVRWRPGGGDTAMAGSGSTMMEGRRRCGNGEVVEAHRWQGKGRAAGQRAATMGRRWPSGGRDWAHGGGVEALAVGRGQAASWSGKGGHGRQRWQLQRRGLEVGTRGSKMTGRVSGGGRAARGRAACCTLHAGHGCGSF